MGEKLHRLSLTVNFDLPIREEKLGGRRHAVLPIVAIVEGVHNRIFYPAAEIAASAVTWNGSPSTVHHPTDENGEAITANAPETREDFQAGSHYNMAFIEDGGKLKGEVWIDVERADLLAPGMLDAIRQGEKLEVSTGLWCDVEQTAGTWNGEAYDGIARNIRPDHIALLPGSVGACSWDDGCGIRPNEGADSTTKYRWYPTKRLTALGRAVKDAAVLIKGELSHTGIRRQLQSFIDGLDNDQRIHFVRDVFDGKFVYEAQDREPGRTTLGPKLYQQDYTVDGQDNVSVGGDPVEVREKTEFVPVTNAGDQNGPQGSQNKEESKMAKTKAEVIAALIACERCPFIEEDATWLEAQKIEKLESFLKVAETPPPQPDPPEPPEPPKKPEGDEAAEKKEPEGEGEGDGQQASVPLTESERAALNRLMRQEDDRKATLIKALLADSRTKLTEKQLKAKPIEELETLVEYGRVDVNYALNAGGNDGEKTGPPPMPKLTDLIAAEKK